MARKTRQPATSKKDADGTGDLRDKIKVAALIEALEQHVLGKKEMTSTQVSAALALLKKTMPDMSEPLRRLMQENNSNAALSHEDALKDLE